MRMFVAVITALGLAQGAFAQYSGLRTSSYNEPRVQASLLNMGVPREGLNDRLECLREKATGRTICKTRGQWRQIARRMDDDKIGH